MDLRAGENQMEFLFQHEGIFYLKTEIIRRPGKLTVR